MDSDLSHVCVAPILMIADDRDLDHERSDRILSAVLDRNDNPATRLAKVDYFYFVEIVEVSSAPDGDSGWRVRLVELVIAVDEDLADCRLARELNVD